VSLLRRSLGLCFTGLLLALPVSADASELVDMVRDLNARQYQMVLGVESARSDVTRQMSAIESALDSIPVEELKEDRNAWAAAIYLLGGGATASMRSLMERKAFSEKSTALISGSLAYAEGHAKEADQLLGPLDARSYPGNIGGYLSLVQGGLQMKTNVQSARAHLRFARLAAPDSLVEEAALRREIVLLEPISQFDDMLMLGRRYAARYPKSPFAQRFWSALSAAAVNSALTLDRTQLARLEEVLEGMAARDRSVMHLEIARKAILDSRLDMARAEIEKARTTDKGEADKRVKFYRTLVDAVSSASIDTATSALSKDEGALTSADKQLGKIVLDGLRALEAATSEGARKFAQTAASDGDDAANAEPQLPKAVAEALARSGETLERAARQ
jgi:chemotaxis protein MotC